MKDPGNDRRPGQPLTAEVEKARVKVNLAQLQRDYETQRRVDVAAERDEARRDRDRFAQTIEFRVKELDEARAEIERLTAEVDELRGKYISLLETWETDRATITRLVDDRDKGDAQLRAHIREGRLP